MNCNCDDSERTTKNLYIFLNGQKCSGQKVVVTQSRWHHILCAITSKLDPYFGKVEKLYTTSSGLTVNSFTDLKNNATYVASNRRKYTNVKGGYTVNTEQTQEYFEHYLSSQLRRINKCKKLAYVRRDLLVIYIFRNGECGTHFKIVLTSDDLSSWSRILSYIALTIDEPDRVIQSLYSVNGNRICGPWELQHGASYVAVGYYQNFRPGCYHVEHKTTEVLTHGYPAVSKDKNLACAHRVKRRMKQPFKWNHFEQYDCYNPTHHKGKCKMKRSKCKINRKNSSQTELSEEATKSKQKRNKKVTVHMRIQKPGASNITITRNSGDSARKKSKTSEDSSSSDNETSKICTTTTCCGSHVNRRQTGGSSSSERSDSSNSKIPTTSKTSSTSEKRKKKQHSLSSEKRTKHQDPSTHDKRKKDHNLTWKPVKNNKSETFLEESEKVVIKLCGGPDYKMVHSDSDSCSEKPSKSSLKEHKKSCAHKKCPANKKPSFLEKCCKRKPKPDKPDQPKKDDCATDCEGKDECIFYKISKPAEEKFICPNSSPNPKHKSKPHNVSYKLNRDGSDSRVKRKHSRVECREAPEQSTSKCCKTQTQVKKKTSLVKKISQFFGSSSGETVKDHHSNCSICRLQQERKNLTRRRC